MHHVTKLHALMFSQPALLYDRIYVSKIDISKDVWIKHLSSYISRPFVKKDSNKHKKKEQDICVCSHFSFLALMISNSIKVNGKSKKEFHILGKGS